MIVWVVSEDSFDHDPPIGVAGSAEAALAMMKAEHPDRRWVARSTDADGSFWMDALRPGHDVPKPGTVRWDTYSAIVHEVAE